MWVVDRVFLSTERSQLASSAGWFRSEDSRACCSASGHRGPRTPRTWAGERAEHISGEVERRGGRGFGAEQRLQEARQRPALRVQSSREEIGGGGVGGVLRAARGVMRVVRTPEGAVARDLRVKRRIVRNVSMFVGEHRKDHGHQEEAAKGDLECEMEEKNTSWIRNMDLANRVNRKTDISS